MCRPSPASRASRLLRPSSRRSISTAARTQALAMDDDLRVLQPLALGELVEDLRMGRVEADAAGRGWTAEPADLVRPVDGVVAVVEDRIGHRRVVVAAR